MADEEKAQEGAVDPAVSEEEAVAADEASEEGAAAEEDTSDEPETLYDEYGAVVQFPELLGTREAKPLSETPFGPEGDAAKEAAADAEARAEEDEAASSEDEAPADDAA